ncbi:MAG: ribonuclease Y [Gemmatimonadales bacterium]
MLPTNVLPLLGGLLTGMLLAGIAAALYLRRQRQTASAILGAARAEADRITAEGRHDADRLRADSTREAEAARAAAVVEGKMEALRLREEVEREVTRRREEVERMEFRVEERAQSLDRRTGEIKESEQRVAGREAELRRLSEQLDRRQAELGKLEDEERRRLERVAGLSVEEARRELIQKIEDEARGDAAALARDIKEQARKGADKEARRIISMAVQRIAAEHTAETTVAAVTLPNDEMKGRIIGREGRNIRAFETATGVDVIIDDTPDTVVISCFDPIRREVARRALDALIADGRIHPGRIEEVVAKLQAEIETQLVELGEQASYEVGVSGVHPELIKLLGRMRYRTSYGQNLLEHSKEVAWLAGIMAAELKVDVALAKRGALLHDIGKVLTHEHEGTHVELGVEVARKYGEQPLVVNCIQAHHDDVPHETTESVLVQAADAISGSRPGARREAFESYVKRLTRLEELANAFEGVEKTSVIQAGREIRVVVQPERVDDLAAASLSENIAKRIEAELQYPGQIKVVVIRETRAVGFAR